VPKLIYSAITSLDGYVADRDGSFDWAAPGAEVHAFVNELERPIDTYLYGRRMYDGTQSLPDGVRVKLGLLDERRFGSASSTCTTAVCRVWPCPRRGSTIPARALRPLRTDGSS